MHAAFFCDGSSGESHASSPPVPSALFEAFFGIIMCGGVPLRADPAALPLRGGVCFEIFSVAKLSFNNAAVVAGWQGC